MPVLIYFDIELFINMFVFVLLYFDIELFIDMLGALAEESWSRQGYRALGVGLGIAIFDFA